MGGQHRSQTVKTFVAQTADQWRKWLDEHHDSESEVWLIFYKLHTGVVEMKKPGTSIARRSAPLPKSYGAPFVPGTHERVSSCSPDWSRHA